MLGNQRYLLPCGHQTERCSAIQNYCQGPWEKERDICKHKLESVSRRFSNRNRFLADFWMFPWFLWCTCSRTSLDSAGGNRQLAVATPDKHILTALKNRFLRSIHSSLFWLSLRTPEENSQVGVVWVTVVAACVTVTGALFASKRQYGYIFLFK